MTACAHRDTALPHEMGADPDQTLAAESCDPPPTSAAHAGAQVLQRQRFDLLPRYPFQRAFGITGFYIAFKTINDEDEA